ncbi:MAG: toxic anion resistance protein [Chloroflexota bacterium]
MAIEERKDNNENVIEGEVVQPGTTEIVPVGKVPTPPKVIKEEEAESLRQSAAEIAKQLETASGSRELEAVDSISNLGIQAQRAAASELNLLRGRVGDMITREGAGGAVTKDMAELRIALRQINPHELAPKGFLDRLAGTVPFGRQLKSLQQVVEKIALRYEPVSKQISVIEVRLREGRAMLVKDNVELRKLYEHVESQQLPLQRNAYLGELLMQELERLIQRTEDPVKRERITNVLYDVSMRIQDLRTMETVHEQFFVSIEMTRQNNTRLGQTLERTLSLSTNVITVGLAIQMALARQKRVLEATQRTQEFLGNVVVANASAIKRHTAEIGDAYNNPVIAIDKLAEAQNDLIEAIETADRVRQQGIDSTKENITKLSQLAEEIRQKASALKEPEKSVEA